MSDATIGIIGTILGTMHGFGLSELSTWFRERRAANQRAKVVRQLVVMDMQAYLAELAFTLKQVRLSTPGGAVHSQTSPTPVFQQILQSQPLLVAEVFKPEHVGPLLGFFGSMEAIIGYLQQLSRPQEPERFDELKVLTIAIFQRTLAIGTPLLEQLTQYDQEQART